jgi:riboflavin kinase/FMN adenylyltransferase
VEAHLLDFDDDIYGAEIEVAIHHRLRGEMRFESVDVLIAQLHADVEATRRILG